jgi:hypothetical protein
MRHSRKAIVKLAGGILLRRVLGIGLAWTALWAVFWTIAVTIIGIVHPGSIDPGEGPLVMVATLEPMGLLSGIAFGLLASIWGRGRSTTDRSLIHLAACGILAFVLVQLAYLDHGNLGLAANINMALVFSAIGGLMTIAWLMMARRWSQRRSSLLRSS